jgi:hypothetical protein
MQKKKQLLSILFVVSLILIGTGAYAKSQALGNLRLLMPAGILLQTVVVAWALILFATNKEKQ